MEEVRSIFFPTLFFFSVKLLRIYGRGANPRTHSLTLEHTRTLIRTHLHTHTTHSLTLSHTRTLNTNTLTLSQTALTQLSHTRTLNTNTRTHAHNALTHTLTQWKFQTSHE